MINIEKKKLMLLLEERKHFFKNNATIFQCLFGLIGYCGSIILSQFWKLDLPIIIAISILTLIYIVMSVILICQSKYSPEALLRDICKVSSNHKFTLLILKDDKGRFLVKYDKRWKTYLFPYTSTQDNNNKDLIDFCKQTLNLDNINIVKEIEHEETKMSASSNMTKTYLHKFCQISDYDKLPSDKKFKINGYTYRWMDILQMKENKSIKSKNEETITYVSGVF